MQIYANDPAGRLRIRGVGRGAEIIIRRRRRTRHTWRARRPRGGTRGDRGGEGERERRAAEREWKKKTKKANLDRDAVQKTKRVKRHAGRAYI